MSTTVDNLASNGIITLESTTIGNGCIVKRGCSMMFKESRCLEKGCGTGVATESALKKYEKQHGGGGFIISGIKDYFGNVMIQFEDWHKKKTEINKDFFCADGECMHRTIMEGVEM